MTVITGSDAHEELVGTENNDTILGLGGHDILKGGDGDDTLDGGDGNDILYGDEGNDTLIAGAGYDILDGGGGSDTYLVGLDGLGMVNLYIDTGFDGTDVILATDAGTVIGLNGFNGESGIEEISANGLEGVTIAGSDEAQSLVFTNTILTGIGMINALGGHDFVIGNHQRNHIDGGDGHDVIDGAGGNDWLYGGAGNDIIDGGNGRDRLFAGTGYDTLDGGEGSDLYFVGLSDTGQVNIFNDTGDEGKDRILATEDGTVIGLNGFGPDSGIEVISGRKFADVTIAGNDEAQTLDFSGTKIHRIAMIEGLGGHDTIIGNAQNNRMDGGDGHDILHGEDGNDWLYGGANNDIIYGGNGRDKLFAGSGHDIIDGGEGSDVYIFDTSSNEGSNDMIDTGTEGRDRAIATEDGTMIGLATVFSADNGIEVISGRKHDDVSIFGTAVDNEWDFTDVRLNNIEFINGALGNDSITGSNRRDTLLGGEGNDELFGAGGRDTLDGGVGDDFLAGGRGRDTLTGGEGLDIFAFEARTGRDIVTDFTAGEDLIDLTALEGVDSFEDLRIRDTDAGAQIFLDGGRVLLEGVSSDALSADMFLFGA